MSMNRVLEADVIVVGGGTAGAVVAARLAERGHEVLVLEAGPDLGPFGDPRWPEDLLDATRLGVSYDWGFDSGDTIAGSRMRFERSRVIGGCSVHNGAVQTWGHRADYDGWAAAGNPGWSTDELLPHFEQASERLRVHTYEPTELTPWQEGWYSAGPSVGLPQLADLNDLDETVGIAPESVNIVDGVRFNSAFAYLDPARALPNLRILGDALVDRVIVEGGRAVGVVYRCEDEEREARAPRVVLAGGTFCTPAVLLRSGIGAPEQLARFGIPVVAALPGVGGNLHDQPFVLLSWEGSEAMTAAMTTARAAGWAPDEQVMAKAASRFDPALFDIHLLPFSPTQGHEGRLWNAGAGCLQPLSRGSVTLASVDPEVLPVVDHRFYSDPEGHDLAVLADGLALLRDLASVPTLAPIVGREIGAIAALESDAEIAAYLRSHVDSYWHPVGTATMGPASDPLAVVDARGEVHGVSGCFVADCSLMPAVPRATTAMPATVIGERVAHLLIESMEREY